MINGVLQPVNTGGLVPIQAYLSKGVSVSGTTFQRYGSSPVSAGIRNFFGVYRPNATSFALINASGPERTLVAAGVESQPLKVYDATIWAMARRQSTE